jgi:predicted dehydrogenase
MEEYLRLLSQGKINISSLVQKTCPVEEAGALYDELASSPVPPLLSILEYDGPSDSSPRVETGSGQKISGTIGVAIVGAGAFARGVHLPNLARLKDQFRLVAIVSKRGSNAKEAAEQFNAAYATTDFQEVLKDEDVQLIIISTRHNLHAPMAMEAIRAGKGVLLEKPLAISRDELNSLKEILESSQAPFMVGFNRRFSPIAAVVRDVLKDRQNPFVLNYVMNAGYIPPEHWVHSAEGGGRNVGEACHIYDLFSFFSGGRLASISAQGITPLTRNVYRNDNFSATAKFDDGSVCNLIYTAQGNGGLAKERMEIHFEGKSIEMSDYRKLTFHGISRKNVELQSAEKGQLEELVEMARCMREGIPHPIPLWQLVQATEMSLDVEEMLG